MRVAGVVALALTLAACVPGRRPPSVTQTPPPAAVVPMPITPANAREAGIQIEQRELTLESGKAEAALAAFRVSCPALVKRTDGSGLTQAGDWSEPCREATMTSDAVAFFRAQFVPVRVGDGQAFVTGYYEPEVAGSRVRDDAHQVPVYRLPDDLLTRQVEDCPLTVSGPPVPCKLKTQRGRLQVGQFVPYLDRGEIEDGALAGRGLELAWAADPIELFFVEVQGSGRLRLPDGGVMRIGYAGQNGHPYTGIGALMKQRGLLPTGKTSMQGIVAALRAQPDGGRAIMRENRSYVFFRELTGPGPLGALGLPVTPRTTLAADPAFVPLGAPVLFEGDRPELAGLWVAQDTGGAIKGANRFDSFWGAGGEASTIAGGLQARMRALILLPRVAAERLRATPRP